MLTQTAILPLPRAYRQDCLRHLRAVFSPVQDLFQDDEGIEVERTDSAPLAARMRPRSLDELVGQEHILGPGKLLRRAIEADRLPSVIFSGPPGSGKTTLARIIAEMTHAKFIRISGVESNVAEIRRVIAAAANRLRERLGARDSASPAESMNPVRFPW